MRGGIGLAAVVAAVMATGAARADYVVVRRTVAVNATPDKVWSIIGDYCAITKMLDVTCTFASGTGDVGSVRSLNGGATLEPLVARTAHSYTYTQTHGAMADYGYHGTIAAEPAGPGKSELAYTLMFDTTKMAPAEVAAQRTRLEGRFQGAIDKVKALAEAR